MENSKALSTHLTPEHNVINELFVKKVVDLLNSGEAIVKAYSINSYTYSSTESVSIDLPGGQSLAISLSTTK